MLNHENVVKFEFCCQKTENFVFLTEYCNVSIFYYCKISILKIIAVSSISCESNRDS
jgi:hypothetical protein